MKKETKHIKKVKGGYKVKSKKGAHSRKAMTRRQAAKQLAAGYLTAQGK